MISFNANGIRAAARKGFFEWLKNENPDVLCVQETKAHESQLIEDSQFFPTGYTVSFYDAQKKGYSGVALYAKTKPDAVVKGLGFASCDDEGRYLHFEYGDLIIASIYFPSGTTGDSRQTIKYEFLERFIDHLNVIKRSGRSLILCGDYNIAHKKIDIKNWRGNLKHSGFLPEERVWMDELFGLHNMVDAFRAINSEADQYTWWSNRGNAWQNNVGWRIDYQVITNDLASKVEKVNIYKAQRFSDHAPLVITYAI